MNAASYVDLEPDTATVLRWIAVGIASAVALMLIAVTLLGALLWTH
jgi:hypothetical protein